MEIIIFIFSNGHVFFGIIKEVVTDYNEEEFIYPVKKEKLIIV